MQDSYHNKLLGNSWVSRFSTNKSKVYLQPYQSHHHTPLREHPFKSYLFPSSELGHTNLSSQTSHVPFGIKLMLAFLNLTSVNLIRRKHFPLS